MGPVAGLVGLVLGWLLTATVMVWLLGRQNAASVLPTEDHPGDLPARSLADSPTG